MCLCVSQSHSVSAMRLEGGRHVSVCQSVSQCVCYEARVEGGIHVSVCQSVPQCGLLCMLWEYSGSGVLLKCVFLEKQPLDKIPKKEKVFSNYIDIQDVLLRTLFWRDKFVSLICDFPPPPTQSAFLF